ncbi:MAG TPA: O-antigen ligase family protein [Terriglobales bacterium]|jgi:O-antigen ligase
MNATANVLRIRRHTPSAHAAVFALKALFVAVKFPSVIFLGALTAMLFRPPDLKAFPIDRVFFVVLLAAIALRLVTTRDRLHTYPATWPMLALLLLSLRGVLAQSYQPQAWSLFAAKWLVPFMLFHIAGNIFREENSLRKLETFSLVVLLYLTVVAVLFLFDVGTLIFPRFILDEGIGIHADRARGPFLQAVANGVSISILELLALHSFERGRLRRVLAMALFAGVPLALLATRTRAVWFAAAAAAILLMFFGSSRKVRQACAVLCVLGSVGLCLFVIYRADSNSLTDRLQDRSPVDFRLDMYQAGWQMFTEKPIMGWGSEGQIQPEVARRISNFHPEYYLFHNTYLELAVERGILGLGLYAWLVISLFQLARAPACGYEGEATFLGRSFRKMWPLVLVVYFLNASAVVMNYQFVNGFVFTLAGILSAQNYRTQASIERHNARFENRVYQ